MKTPQEIARDICSAKGMVCLVPNENSMCGISSHEKTLCDCEVEELIAQAIKAERERSRVERERAEKFRKALEAVLSIEAIAWMNQRESSNIINQAEDLIDEDDKSKAALEGDSV